MASASGTDVLLRSMDQNSTASDHLVGHHSSSRRTSLAGLHKEPVHRKLVLPDPDTPLKKHSSLMQSNRTCIACIRTFCLGLLGITAAIIMVILGINFLAASSILKPAAVKRDTLVLYMFANTDSEYINNLKYFIQEAITAQADKVRADYVIVVQIADDIETIPLPDLPSNARYVYHRNQCYDWGTYGWLLRSGALDIDRYTWFFFVNSSVKGPFLPSYLRGHMHWTTPFISQLTDDVKLVGPVISCEGSPFRGDASAGPWRRNPHVQSYAIATDSEGLRVLLDDPHVFECHSDRWDAIWYSELGSSAAILKAGYNLGSFMIRYQGVDWRDVSNWGCNAAVSPTGEGYNDGQSVDPYEVMFVKYKSFLLDSGSGNSIEGSRNPTAALATKYQLWQEQQLQKDDWDKGISRNDYSKVSATIKLPKVLMTLRRGSGCFDIGYYLENSPDIKAKLQADETAAWKHFVMHGQFQDRLFRFLCDDVDYDAIAKPPA